MKILIALAAVVAIASAASMTELSGFKTADQLLQDVQSDSDNIYGLVFFKKDDSNFELTQSNKKLIDGLKDVANEKAPKIEDSDNLYFARIDLSVPENKRLVEKFGLTETSCDKYPAAAVLKNAGGHKIEGPAIVSLFSEKIDAVAGLEDKEEGDAAEGDAAEGEEAA